MLNLQRNRNKNRNKKWQTENYSCNNNVKRRKKRNRRYIVGNQLIKQFLQTIRKQFFSPLFYSQSSENQQTVVGFCSFCLSIAVDQRKKTAEKKPI